MMVSADAATMTGRVIFVFISLYSLSRNGIDVSGDSLIPRPDALRMPRTQCKVRKCCSDAGSLIARWKTGPGPAACSTTTGFAARRELVVVLQWVANATSFRAKPDLGEDAR